MMFRESRERGTRIPWNVRAALLMGVVLLPFWSNPLRYSPHDPHREGILLALALLAFVSVRQIAVRRGGEWVLFAVVGGWVSWLLSSGFALSPVMAVAGTSLRADGLVFQVGLTGALMAGCFASVRGVGRWLWGVGLLVSGVIVAQWLGWLPSQSPGTTPRPSGTWGLPAFTSGWLVLAIVWAWVARPHRTSRWIQWGYYVGLSGIVFALMLTGTRGSVLALFGAAGMALATWAGRHRGRWLSAGVIAAAVGVLAVGLLNQLRFIPLFERLDPHTTGYTHRFRARLWQNTQDIARFQTVMRDVDLNPDPHHHLRPLLGYGPAHFEQLHRPYAYADQYFRERYAENKVIDRAHNDWLDIIPTRGWLGVLSRAGLWLAVYGMALRRLGGFRPWVLLLPVLGSAAGGVLLWGQPWLPLGITAGALIGMGIGVLWRSPDFLPDEAGQLALLMLAAHMIEVQFLFPVVANTVLFWVMLGLLITDCQPRTHSQSAVGLLPLVALLLARQWLPMPAVLSSPFVDAGIITFVVAWCWQREVPRVSGRHAFVTVSVLVVGAFYVLWDTKTDHLYGQTLNATDVVHARPFDVPLRVEATLYLLRHTENDPAQQWQQQSTRHLNRLYRLNRYEPQLAYGRGVLADVQDAAVAQQHYRAAHYLVPMNPIYCRSQAADCPILW